MANRKKSLEEIGKARRINSLKRISAFCKRDKILDVGCKFGYTSDYFDKKGYNVEGIDINKEYVLKAKKSYGKINFSIKDVSKDIKKKYDTILLIGVLEEINMPPTEVLKILKKNLNPRGRIIIQVRNANSLKRGIRNLFGLEPLDPFSSRLWVFSRKRLSETINKAGYELIKMTSNKFQSFNKISVPVPDNLSEEIWAIIKLRERRLGK